MVRPLEARPCLSGGFVDRQPPLAAASLGGRFPVHLGHRAGSGCIFAGNECDVRQVVLFSDRHCGQNTAGYAGSVAISGVYWAVNRASLPRLWDCLALLILPIVYLATAMTSDLNLGIRHILPIYPFLFVILGLTAADGLRRFPRPSTLVISLFLLGLALETYTAYPDFIPFFNVAAGGWENGPRLLGDSNVDWGQGLAGRPMAAATSPVSAIFQLFRIG